MNRVILFIIGLLLSTIGFSFIIIYLNLLVMGYTFLEYLMYILKKVECIIFFIGYLFIIFSIFHRKRGTL